MTTPDDSFIADLKAQIDYLLKVRAHLERENAVLRARLGPESDLEAAMARNGYGTVTHPPRRRR